MCVCERESVRVCEREIESAGACGTDQLPLTRPIYPFSGCARVSWVRGRKIVQTLSFMHACVWVGCAETPTTVD